MSLNKEEEKLILAPKHFTEFSPPEWREYVRSLFRLPEAKEKARDFSFRVNDKGTPIITIRNRKPKYLTPEEVETLAKEENLSAREMWLIVGKKKIPIKRGDQIGRPHTNRKTPKRKKKSTRRTKGNKKSVLQKRDETPKH